MQDPQKEIKVILTVFFFQIEIPLRTSMQQAISLTSHTDSMINILNMNATTATKPQ